MFIDTVLSSSLSPLGSTTPPKLQNCWSEHCSITFGATTIGRQTSWRTRQRTQEGGKHYRKRQEDLNGVRSRFEKVEGWVDNDTSNQDTSTKRGAPSITVVENVQGFLRLQGPTQQQTRDERSRMRVAHRRSYCYQRPHRRCAQSWRWDWRLQRACKRTKLLKPSEPFAALIHCTVMNGWMFQ